MTTTMLTGRDVIAAMERGATGARKYADPTEGERAVESVEDAQEIAREDPSLLYMPIGISDAQIRKLMAEAGEAGDLVQVHACRVALGEEDVIETDEQWEERYGGGGFDARERSQIMGITSAKQARAMCASALVSESGW